MNQAECIFCGIAQGVIPVERLYEDEDVVAFPDLHPQAPFHALVIPKTHIASLAHTTATDSALLGQLLAAATEVARRHGLAAATPNLDEGGYRVVLNIGADGGQTVPHLHLHLLGGRPMGWPPG